MDLDLMTDTDLAALLGVTRKTLSNWRSARTGPRPVPIGGRIHYRRSDVAAWIDAQAAKAAVDWDRY